MEFFIDLYNIFCVNILGVIIFVILICGLALVAYILIMWLFEIIDSSFLPNISGKGIIIKKTHCDEHTSYVPVNNTSLNITTITPVHHEEEWYLTIKVGKDIDEVEVKKSFYKKCKVHDIVDISYCFGRFTNKIYIKDIYGK